MLYNHRPLNFFLPTNDCFISYSSTGNIALTQCTDERQQWGSPTSQDVIYEHAVSHPAFLSLLYRITLKKMHIHVDTHTQDTKQSNTHTLEHIPTQRMSLVVSCGVSVLFSLLLYFTFFLGFFLCRLFAA